MTGLSAVADEAVGRAVRQPADGGKIRRTFQRAQQLAQRVLALAAHDEIDGVRRFVGVSRQARIVAADNNPDRGTQRAEQPGDRQRRAALKRHH